MINPCHKLRHIYKCIAKFVHVHVIAVKIFSVFFLQEGGVSLLRFSPASENILAAVTGAGYVAIWELNLHEHGESKVSALSGG